MFTGIKEVSEKPEKMNFHIYYVQPQYKMIIHLNDLPFSYIKKTQIIKTFNECAGYLDNKRNTETQSDCLFCYDPPLPTISKNGDLNDNPQFWISYKNNDPKLSDFENDYAYLISELNKLVEELERFKLFQTVTIQK